VTSVNSQARLAGWD